MLYRSTIGAFAVGKIDEEQRFDVVRHACPGAGACGGMYTYVQMSFEPINRLIKQLTARTP